MPRIIVQADPTPEREAITVLQERVSPSDLESAHFANQLLERLNWAVGDAKQAELERQDLTVEAEDGGGRGRFRKADADGVDAELDRAPVLLSS
jgi:hypothetical protein